MCDTLVHAPAGGPVWLAKNSDREPDEAQATELVHPGEPAPSDLSPRPPPPLSAAPRHAAAISRPVWLWGCEMGVNARGLGVANEAVFTRVPVPDAGLTGMDLQRHALEQCATAEEALERIVALLAAHPQGGRMALKNRRMRYHSSFALADPREAWILETAGPYWAARRVTGAWTLSNALTIGADFDRIHPDAFTHARARGWCRGAADFSFARSFSAPLMSALAGAATRRACTAGHLHAAPTAQSLIAALRDHNGRHPTAGLHMTAPCAHASRLPTRAAGQTTSAMIARLGAPPTVWFTGGPAPCLGVFKPVRLDAPVADPHPPGLRPDRSGWWRQHALHRAVLRDYAPLRARFADERDALQRTCLQEHVSIDMCLETWSNHHEATALWLARAHAR